MCSLVYDIPNGRITTLLDFFQGYSWRIQEAHGDNGNAVDFEGASMFSQRLVLILRSICLNWLTFVQ